MLRTLRVAIAGAALATLAHCQAYDRGVYANLVDATAESADTTPDARTDTPAIDGLDVQSADVTDAPDATTCAPTHLVSFCSSIPSLPATPVIDGLLDCGPMLIPVSANGWSNTGQSLPLDVSASFALAWRPDGLYLFTHVETPRVQPALDSEAVWCGDSVEMYIDADGLYQFTAVDDDPGGVHITVNAPADAAAPVRIKSTRGDAGYVPYPTPRVVAVRVAGGYNVEAFVNAEDLHLTNWHLASGARIGFDVAVNVSVPPGQTPFYPTLCAHYDGQFALHIAAPTNECRSGIPSCTVGAFCNPTLTP